MAFQLTIAAGKEAGREFVFDQKSVVIGRTDECDVLLYDSGISRKHARIFVEGTGFFVEDLGSSNGTKVNSVQITRQGLNDGDSLTLGPVTFTFKAVAVEPSTDPAMSKPEHDDDPSTRIVDLSLLPKSRNKGVAMVPQDMGGDELKQLGRRSTAMMPMVRASSPGMPAPRKSNPAGPSIKLDGLVEPRRSLSNVPAMPAGEAPVPRRSMSNLPAMPGGDAPPPRRSLSNIPAMPGNEAPPPRRSLSNIPAMPGNEAPPPRRSLSNIPAMPGNEAPPPRRSLSNIPAMPGAEAPPPRRSLANVPAIKDLPPPPIAVPPLGEGVDAPTGNNSSPDLGKAARPSRVGLQKISSGTEPGIPSPIAAAQSSELGIGEGDEPPTRMTAIPSAAKISAISAAERLRLKRNAPAMGKLQIWWAEAGKGARAAIWLAGLAVLAGIVGGLYAATSEKERKPKPKEPNELIGEPIAYSFGLGEGVMFEHPDEKAFTFDLNTPVESMVVLHYQSKDITEHEVAVAVNGIEMGWLPADTLVSDDVEHELLVASKSLKRNEQNNVVFDNVNNPPGTEAWRIWNVWVEIVVLPEMDQAALILEANAKLKRGLDMWEHRTIGAANTWMAYKNFREAWLWLEAMPAVSRPASYEMAIQKMHEAGKVLDEQCTELLRQARTATNYKKYKEAQSIINHVADVFPSKAHPCQARADAEREELDL